MSGKISIHGVNGFSLSELQMAMKFTLDVRLIQFFARVGTMTQQTMMSFW